MREDPEEEVKVYVKKCQNSPFTLGVAAVMCLKELHLVDAHFKLNEETASLTHQGVASSCALPEVLALDNGTAFTSAEFVTIMQGMALGT